MKNKATEQEEEEDIIFITELNKMCSCNSSSNSSCNGMQSKLFGIRRLGVRCYNNTMDQKYLEFIEELDSMISGVSTNNCPDEQYINTLQNYIDSEYKKLN